MKSHASKILSAVVFIAVYSAAARGSDTITGIAHNQTSGRPAAGDEVVLLGLNQSVQEETRTKTDAQGSFTLKVRNPVAAHLVRVVHQGVNYDRHAGVGDVVFVDVFDKAANVQGLTGGLEVIRIGTNGNLLHVSDMIEIRNDSSPPLTQAGERTLEVYLPAHAKIDSVLAAGSDSSSTKTGVMISAVPMHDEPGHYAVSFPLKPGATKFAFNYDLPYDGHATFHTKSAYSRQQLAVMMPETMKFKSQSPAFQILPSGNNNYQVEAAIQLKAGEGPIFEVSGVGAFPTLQSKAQAPSKPPIAALSKPALPAPSSSGARAQAQNANTSVAEPASEPSATSSRSQWSVVGASAVLLLVAGGFFVWRRHRPPAQPIVTAVQKIDRRGRTSESLLDALQEEVSQLESDRLQGAISGEEYASAKQALEATVKRALARARVNAHPTRT